MSLLFNLIKLYASGPLPTNLNEDDNERLNLTVSQRPPRVLQGSTSENCVTHLNTDENDVVSNVLVEQKKSEEATIKMQPLEEYLIEDEDDTILKEHERLQQEYERLTEISHEEQKRRDIRNEKKTNLISLINNLSKQQKLSEKDLNLKIKTLEELRLLNEQELEEVRLRTEKINELLNSFEHLENLIIE